MSEIHPDDEGSSTANEEVVATPLKKYVTVIGDKRENKWVCNFGCRGDAYTGSYSRVRAHLIGLKKGEKTRGIVLCSKVSTVDREKLKKEEEEARDVFGADLRKRSKADSQLKLPLQKRNPAINVVKEMFKMSARDDTNTRIARFFYSCGISFNVARSSFWIDAVKAINEAPKGYKAPSSEKIRTKLLDKEKTNIDNHLSTIKRDWPQYGVSIVSDGWSNIRNQPLINVLAICGGKPIFLTAIDSSGDEKTASYIAEILLKTIENVGKYNVVQILTDNASNCKAAGDIIVARMPHIFWPGCIPHTLSLLMKDVAQSVHPSLAFVGDCYRKVKEVINYVRNHSFVLHIFRKYSSLEVIQVKKTRFGHHYVVIERLHKLKNSLITMVLNDDWELIRKGTSRSKLAHDDVKRIILDEQFWKDVKFVLSFTKPIWRMIRFCDSDKAVIGELYQRMEEMLGSVKQALSEHFEMSQEVEALVMKRWERMNLPLHTLAYVLNPYYYSEAWLRSSTPGNVRRGKPHADSFVQGVYLDAIRKLASTQDITLVRRQLSDFTSGGGVFGKPEAIEDRSNMSSIEWWNLYGVAAPQLYSVAIKVLSQSVNSSCAERAWSSYNFIHTVRRNKLNCDRAESLVYVHYNNRILTRYREDYEKVYKNWDRNTYEDYLEDDLELLKIKNWMHLNKRKVESNVLYFVLWLMSKSVLLSLFCLLLLLFLLKYGKYGEYCTTFGWMDV